MGFEYIYAYLENIHWFFVIGTAFSAVAILFLIGARLLNEIDGDDWLLMFGAACGILLVFTLIDLSPSMEHIQKVRTEAIKPYVETKREENDETVYSGTLYPSAYCVNSLMCQGR